jgi:superfamily II DNA/RNA helicase
VDIGLGLMRSTATVSGLKQKYLFIPSQIRDSYLYYVLLHPPEAIDASLRLKKVVSTPAPKRSKSGSKPTKAPAPKDEAPVIPSTIIFAQRCATAHLLHLILNSLSIPSVPLHSHLTQPQRLLSLARFRAGDVPVLVTTDVGSRGLDIPEVAMVINWDCPRRADDYVHRVGRTARAGRGGVAVTIVTERDVELVKIIEDEISECSLGGVDARCLALGIGIARGGGPGEFECRVGRTEDGDDGESNCALVESTISTGKHGQCCNLWMVLTARRRCTTRTLGRDRLPMLQRL